MVATVTPLTSAAVTTRYFEQDGYYAKDDPEHRKASRWHGRGAADLGLSRHVAPSRFEAVLAGKVPGTDTVLGRIRDGEREHRPGVDITMQAPKSVSLAALVAGDGRIVRAHDLAVRATLDFIEEQLLVTRQWDRASRRHSRVKAPSMVAATFRHKANRNLEPHLHTHAVIANMTRRADGSWGSLDMGPLGPAAKLFGAHYRNELAARLRALGYALRPSMVGQVPGFEIEGYDRALLEEHSTRRREILDWVRSRGLANTAANRQKAALATRRQKDEPHHLELEAAWRSRAKEIGLDRAPPRPAAGRRRMAEEAERLPTMLEIVARSVEHLAERSSVFREADLCMQSLAHSPGMYSHKDYITARDQLKRDGHLVDAVRRGLGPCLVTSRALRAERGIIAMMKSARGIGRPLADRTRVESALSESGLTDGQREAVRAILLGGSGITGVQGYAGTGKTAMLRTVRELAGERRVIGLAPSAAAVQGIRREAGLAARTLQGFLSRYRDVADGTASEESIARLRAEFAGSILVLDEASMVGTTQMQALMRIAEALDVGRLALVGDVRQLRAVEAGQPFRQLQQAGMPTKVMDDILRQRTGHLRETVAHIIAERPGEAVGSLGDDIHEVETADLGRTAGRLWLDLDSPARASTVVLAPTHEIRAEINGTVRDGLAEEGVLRGSEIEILRLVSRGMTRPQTGDIRNWDEGDAVVFHHDLWGGKARAGEVFTVNAIDGERAELVHDDGRTLRVRPGGKQLRYQLELHETATIRIREGDVIRWTRNDNRRGLVNGEQARVLAIGAKTVRFRTGDGRSLRLSRDDPQLRHVDHAYSSTVHAAQGLTADRVIAVLDSGHGALTDQATFYVEVSRARDEVVVLTDNREQLAETLEERTGLRMTALEAVGEMTKDRETGTAPEIALPEKPLVQTTARALETLRAEARETGGSILDAPGFRDLADRLERERNLPGLPDDEWKSLEAWSAEIGREIALRDAVTRYPERSLAAARTIYASEQPVGPDSAARKQAMDLVSEGRSMLDSPEAVPHLDHGDGVRNRVVSGLAALRSSVAFNEAERTRGDWQALEARAMKDNTIPFHSAGYADLITRIGDLAADIHVPVASREVFETILDGHRAEQDRYRETRDILERAHRSRRKRAAILRDDRPGVPRLPQQRSEYPEWRKEAENLHADGSRIQREGSAWIPHLDAVRWSLDGLRGWLQRLAALFRRDDLVLELADRNPVHDFPERGADDRHSVPSAGDLVLGDRIRWLERRVMADGDRAVAREGRIIDIRHRSDDKGDRVHVSTGVDMLADPVRAATLLKGDVHRQPWPDENERETMRAEPAGPFTIPCEVEENDWYGAPDQPGEARVVPGDRIRWTERVPGKGPEDSARVRAIAARVDEVDAGYTPKRDRIRLTVIASTGTDAFPPGHELKIEPRRLHGAGPFHRAAWANEAERTGRLETLEQRTLEIGRERGQSRDFGYGM